MKKCDAKIRPFLISRVIECENGVHHPTAHVGTLHDYAHPGSETKITWLESDRRNFHGDWPGVCYKIDTGPGCVLPKGHLGDCAI